MHMMAELLKVDTAQAKRRNKRYLMPNKLFSEAKSKGKPVLQRFGEMACLNLFSNAT